jgi:hypothetical protein
MCTDPVESGSYPSLPARTGELDEKQQRFAYPKCSSIQFLAREEGEDESPDMRRPSSGKGLQLWNKADIYSQLPSRSSFVLWKKLFHGKNTLPKMFAKTNIFAKSALLNLMSQKSFDKIEQHLVPNFFYYLLWRSPPPLPYLIDSSSDADSKLLLWIRIRPCVMRAFRVESGFWSESWWN